MNIKEIAKSCNLPLERVTAITTELKNTCDLSKIPDSELIKIILEINDFISQGDTVEIAITKLVNKYNQGKVTDTANLTSFINSQSDKISDLLSDNFSQMIMKKTWEKTVSKLSDNSFIESQVNDLNLSLSKEFEKVKTLTGTSVYLLTGNVV